MDHHDDGLVHSHGWAREQPRHRPADGRRNHSDVRGAMNAHPAQQEFDDGLVHGHSWACGERGRPRH
jgi:hypothetical protein